MLRSIVAAAALAALSPALPAHAQTAAPSITAPEPARLTAARILIEKFLPADRRDAMVDQMMRPMVENMRSTLVNGPAFESMKAENPKFGPAFDAFMNAELERSIATTKAAMPGLVEAMARAYARRFTLDQLRELGIFFDTPTGRLYVETAPSLMSDPDVLAAQTAMMKDAMTGMQQRIEKFATQASADAKKTD